MQELTAYKKKSTEAYAALNTVRRKLENQCKASPDNSTFKIHLQITGKELSDKAKSIKDMYSYRAENKPDTSESIGTEKGERI